MNRGCFRFGVGRLRIRLLGQLDFRFRLSESPLDATFVFLRGAVGRGEIQAVVTETEIANDERRPGCRIGLLELDVPSALAFDVQKYGYFVLQFIEDSFCHHLGALLLRGGKSLLDYGKEEGQTAEQTESNDKKADSHFRWRET